jgi:hypothetical protein
MNLKYLKRQEKLNKEKKLEKLRKHKAKEYKKKYKTSSKTSSKIYPKCIYSGQQICLSSSGYFTPCCWFDDELYRKQPWVNTIFREHLKIENNETLDDIFNSKEWTNLFNMLINNSQDAPAVCKKMCGSKLITEKKLNQKQLGDNNKMEVRIRN